MPNDINSIMIKQKANKKSYDLDPKLCKFCGKCLPYEKRRSNFCNRSCSASYTNRVREKSTTTKTHDIACMKCNKIETKSLSCSRFICKECNIIIRKTKRRIGKNPNTIITHDKVGPSCKIYINICSECGKLFTVSTNRKTCSNECYSQKAYNRDRYKFKFNIFSYPDIFDLCSLSALGFCSFGGKRGGSYNPKGLSRDHKISVYESIKNNYDPYYITHPLNCELMTMEQNNKKKTNSSITYSELKQLIDEYERKLG